MRSYSKKLCPVTNAPQNWSESPDGNLIIIHDRHIQQSNEWKHIGDSENGSPMYVRVKEGGDCGEKNAHLPALPDEKPVASIEDRDRVYRKLLELCPLTPEHRAHLEERKIPDLLSSLPFGSLPPNDLGERYHRIIKPLLDAGFTRDFLETVPGFYREASGHLVMSRPAGILIPSLDAKQRIQSFQVRQDKNDPETPRYVWLSAGWIDEQTNQRRGVKSGSPAGIFFPGVGWNGEVALTEGAMKGACLKAHLPQETAVIYAAGVTQLRSIQEAINSLPEKPKQITLFFDADAWRNHQVFTALAKQIQAFQGQEIQTKVAVWSEEIGKGIDDFLTFEPPKQEEAKEGEQPTKPPILLPKKPTIGDVVYLEAAGFVDAFDAINSQNPLHLFPTSLDAAHALAAGLPALCVPKFSPDDRQLDQLKERLEKHEASEVFIHAPDFHAVRGLELARLLVNRDLDVRLSTVGGLEDYLAFYGDEALSLAVIEAKEATFCRSINRLNPIVERVKRASVGREPAIVASAIETLKELAPTLVKGEVLKSIQSEIKASAPAESEVAEMFVRQARSSLAFDVLASQWMAYEGDRWVKVLEKEVLQRVKAFVAKVRPKYSAKFVKGVCEMVSWSLSRTKWNRERNLIPLANGVLDLSRYEDGVTQEDLKTLSLREFDPEDGMTWKLPFAFDPEADCPTIRQWLRDYTAILQEDGTWKPSTEFQDRVIASIAAALRGMGQELQFFLEVIGLPGTGKGTLFRLVEAFMGKNNTFITDLRSFEKDPFATAGIVGKRLMQITDSDDYRDSVQKTRSLTGGDPLYINRKHVQSEGDGYHANVVCMIAANKAIEFKDPGAMERRRVPVRFDRKVEKHEQDTRFGEKLQAELPGLLNWALSLSPERIFEILKVDGADSKEVRRQSLEEQSIGMFVRERLAVDLHGRIKIGELRELSPKQREALGDYYENVDEQLYPAYREFYRTSYGVAGDISSKKFNQDLASFLHASLSIPAHLIFKETKRSRDGYHWRGLALRSGENDDRPNPFDISPTVGDPDLLAKLLEAPKDPNPPSGGPKGGQPAPEVSKSIDTPKQQQADLWVSDEVRARSLLNADVDGVSDFKPTPEEERIEQSEKNVKLICSEVWRQQSVSEAAIQLSLGMFPKIRTEFVGWLWMKYRHEYIRRHESGALHLIPFVSQASSIYEEDEAY